MNSHCRIGKVVLKSRLPDNVVFLRDTTSDHVPPFRVLGGALEKDLQEVLVLGIDKDGRDYFAGSFADMFEVVLILDRFRRNAMGLGS
ncbi:hypothetical protein [Aquamicrobium sp.]|uniref:hypothetical protein n=1 Tax=Aquamicrobium sp. TaxID=1872579 RepID=UPI00258766AA|nr:hypothetical protein [Aquamicrobium sp.]MCK9549202.1 hypothetical protein [Aquamicrobium sp.]